MPGALETLRWHYRHRAAEALAQHKAGVPVVGYTSNTVPCELIRAAGCFPVLLAPDVDDLAKLTPRADQWMEPVFDSAIRRTFDAILSGTWNFLKLLIVPRTSEPEYKLYLYLREAERQKLSDAIPPLWLYDLLHTRNPISRKYGLERTKALVDRLRAISPISGKSLAQAVAESNRARASLRKLQRLRTNGAPRISGADALAASGSMYFMDRAAHAKLIEAACRALKSAKPLRGPRLLIKGTPLHHPKLHEVLEACGAVVVAEDDWWGARAAGPNIPPAAGSSAMLRAVFNHYYLHAPSPRVSPFTDADLWFNRAVRRGIDGVVFYLPPDDDVCGWEYPRHRDFLVAHNIPSLLIRESAARGLSAAALAQIAEFVKAIPGRRRASR
jgi:benzoyl-CoA reductase/2-hydroxyglutaryl-CoA dehydratase subunit BcrC/BadD/HgdB